MRGRISAAVSSTAPLQRNTSLPHPALLSVAEQVRSRCTAACDDVTPPRVEYQFPFSISVKSASSWHGYHDGWVLYSMVYEDQTKKAMLGTLDSYAWHTGQLSMDGLSQINDKYQAQLPLLGWPRTGSSSVKAGVESTAKGSHGQAIDGVVVIRAPFTCWVWPSPDVRLTSSSATW